MGNKIQILASAGKLLERLDRRARRKVATLCVAIVQDTPVDTGKLRHNWRVGIDKPDNTVTDDTGDPTERIIRQILSATKAKKIYFSNSVPYAQYIEMGHSGQSPQGMMRLNLSRFRGFDA